MNGDSRDGRFHSSFIVQTERQASQTLQLSRCPPTPVLPEVPSTLLLLLLAPRPTCNAPLQLHASDPYSDAVPSTLLLLLPTCLLAASHILWSPLILLLLTVVRPVLVPQQEDAPFSLIQTLTTKSA